MPCIVLYACGEWTAVLAASAHPAVTHDAAWRNAAHDMDRAKRFASELDAQTYLARYLPECDPHNRIVMQAVEES